MKRKSQENFIEFIKNSPTALHASSHIADVLKKSGFIQLEESASWHLEKSLGYFIQKNGAILAFRLPKEEAEGAIFHLTHTDSPGFKIKNQPQKQANKLEVLGLEVYGAPLIYTWAGQALHPAGAVYTQNNDKLHTHLVELKEYKTMIAPLAIHLDRDVNQKGAIFNKQTGINPICSLDEPFLDYLKNHFSEKIIGFDLFLVPSHIDEVFGSKNEFLAAHRVDNLSSAFAALEALIHSSASRNNVQVAFFFDHEEIGSRTLEGAESSFFTDTFQRLCKKIAKDEESYYKIKAKSFALSIDVAHAVHPHHGEKHDLEAPPYIGKGPVIKFSAGKKYATTSYLAAKLKMIAKDLPLQNFYPHGEIGSGSTVGPVFSAKHGIETIDIGIPIIGMHALKEIMCFEDLFHLITLLKETYSS